MKMLAIALGTLLTASAASAFAQDNSDRNYPYDPDWAAREQARDLWRNNPGYRDYRYREDRYYDERAGRDRGWRSQQRECWNPRARHFEEVREGEYQDDLDFSRCRLVGGDGYRNRYR